MADTTARTHDNDTDGGDVPIAAVAVMPAQARLRACLPEARLNHAGRSGAWAKLRDNAVIIGEVRLRNTLVRQTAQGHRMVECDRAPAFVDRHRCATARRCGLGASVLAQLLGQVRPRPPRKPRGHVIKAGDTSDERLQLPPDAIHPHRETRRCTAVRTAEAVEEFIA